MGPILRGNYLWSPADRKGCHFQYTLHQTVQLTLLRAPNQANVLAISEGGLRSYKPKTHIRISPELTDKPNRPTRTDFKSSTCARPPSCRRTHLRTSA